jgi:hypothetical protein
LFVEVPHDRAIHEWRAGNTFNLKAVGHLEYLTDDD